MGNLQRPESFNMRDLELEVNLRTCIDGSEYDFTGRKTFDTTFYRQNIGFGITNIEIEINASLQPLIDVTFKDLYGNTLFGTQRGDNNSIDTSVLFNWPPPKFIFSFKGYLGHRVTWLLNLKTTNVSYVSSDGSYEIKCTFVPNQWGFLADIPVLYLLACKKLRYAAYGNSQIKKIQPILKDSLGQDVKGEECIFKTDSVFSYTRIGKRVDTKTTEETKDFDLLTKQLAAIKYSLSNAVLSTKIIKTGEPINGIVNNIPIQGFTNLMVTDGKVASLDTKVKDKSLNMLDTFFQLNIMKGLDGHPEDANYTMFADGGKGVTLDEISDKGELKVDIGATNTLITRKNTIFSIIDKNITLIDKEIKRRVYNSTKSQISKLTIGEVFRQIAQDSGFILGSILQAGFDGYNDPEFKDKRDGEKGLIGKSFPLMLNGAGEEVPAMIQTDSTSGSGGIDNSEFGVKDHEMAFIENFISAIGEGIAENLISDDISETSEDKIKNRINNLEAIQPNPYKAYYSNIAENILIRSGIIAYITRSSEPNKPGGYPDSFKFSLSYTNTLSVFSDDPSSIITLANLDMENLSKGILSQLSFEDAASVKRFCTFFDRLISDDGDTIIGTDIEVKIGEHFLTPLGTAYPVPLSDVLLGYDTPIPDTIMNYKVYMGDYTSSDIATAARDYELSSDKDIKLKAYNTIENIRTGTTASDFLSIKDIMSEIVRGSSLQSGTTKGLTGTTYDIPGSEIGDAQVFYNTAFIDPYTLTATCIKNNGLQWTIPMAQNNTFYYILFDVPSDVSKTIEISSDTTKEDQLKDSEPIGFVAIDSPKKEFKDAIKVINDRIKVGQCLNYSNCKVLYGSDINYLQQKLIQTTDKKGDNEIAAQNLSYAIYTTTRFEDDGTQDLVFGPLNYNTKFSTNDYRALNQRIAIKTMCKAVLKKFDEIEQERNEILANVLGKAGENKNAIYKQMHTIFHQWQVIASTVKNQDLCSKYADYKDLPTAIEEEFGICSNHIKKGDGTTLLSKHPIDGNTLFVYDYPLAPVRQGEADIDVRKSIINIEALYKPNGNTTILGIIQQICTKNNFMFVPFPGDANSDNIVDIYKPYPIRNEKEVVRNYFHVLFTPTPETRTKLSNDSKEFLTDHMKSQTDFKNNAISIEFGSIGNQIIKSIGVGTDSTKPTAESIINLQRLVDKENSNKKVAMDCSMLPVFEGRSYKASIEMIGNAQVYPMQYIYIQTMPMFGGLHQIMKVTHSISPNNMTTKLEAIRMRFSADGTGYGGIPPITLEDLEKLGPVGQPLANIAPLSTTYTGGTDSSTLNTISDFLPAGLASDLSKSVVTEAYKYENKKETPDPILKHAGNYGFDDPVFEADMKSVGWVRNYQWCMLFAKLMWKKALQGTVYWQYAEKLITPSSQSTWANFSNDKSGLFNVSTTPQIGSIVIWQDYTKAGFPHDPLQGHAGIVVGVGEKSFSTIEGNSTNDPNERNGTGVFLKKTRLYSFDKIDGLRLRGFINLVEKT